MREIRSLRRRKSKSDVLQVLLEMSKPTANIIAILGHPYTTRLRLIRAMFGVDSSFVQNRQSKGSVEGVSDGSFVKVCKIERRKKEQI
jgi:hypothetical protein